MLKQFLKLLLFASASLLHMQAKTTDIDLFAYQAPGSHADNVLFVLDNAANFSASVSTMYCSITAGGVVQTNGTGTAPTALNGTAGAVEQCALYQALKSLSVTTTASLNIGIMGFNATGMKTYNPLSDTFSTIASNGQAGYLLMPLTPLNSTTKPRILEYIRQWEISGGSNWNMKGNNTASGAAMQEAWAYYHGKKGMSTADYSTIAPTAGCGRNYNIFIGNAFRNNSTPGDGTNASSSPRLPLVGSALSTQNANPAASTGEKTVIADVIKTQCTTGVTTLQSAEGKGVYALNWARYMKNKAGIITYSIGVLGPTCNDEYAAHLQKLGSTDVGGAKFFGTNNFAELTVAINTALSEILSVNSVFAAVSLPVSVNTQGSYLNQVYVGMFRPADSFLPRWPGNLKQYKLGYVNGVLRLQDADGKGAINNSTGFIAECARSFWTPTSVDTYWTNRPSGGCLSIDGANESNYPDGNIVEKGGQAYRLRQLSVPANRTVKTCDPTFASCTTLTNFNTANTAITQTLLNSTSGATDRDSLINWARGLNLENELTVGTTVTRSSVHGDIVHSRPAAVNHGTDSAPQIVVYYGGNDGLLHAINGNRTTSITSGGSTYAAGDELWSFMPPQFYGAIKRLYYNAPAISFPGTAVTDALPKNWGMDGPVTYFQGTIGGVTKTYLYATMRRGGRVIYAFDVTTPGSPTLLWTKGCPNLTNDTGCSTGFSQLGQTWSSVKPFYASGYGSGASPLVIVSGGYDDCLDYDSNTAGGANHSCTGTSKGNKVLVLDAQTGNIVVSFDTTAPTVADSTIARDSTGMATYAWTSDTLGNVYRMSFGSGATSTWAITPIASLGCGPTATTCTAPRRFLFQPSVTSVDNVTYDVLLGSGDREKPVRAYPAANAVTNYFFKVQDRPSASNWLSGESSNCGSNVMCMNSLVSIARNAADPSDTTLATKKGWYLGLNTSEQVVTSATTLYGVTTFSTQEPAVTSPTACGTDLGTTRVYNVAYTNSSTANGTSSRYEDVAGDGLPPSPVVGRVKLDSGQTVPFCIGCSKDSPLEGSPPKEISSITFPKGRLYWSIQQ